MDNGPAGHVQLHVNFSLKTGDGLKEKQLEDRMREEAKKHLQAAIGAL